MWRAALVIAGETRQTPARFCLSRPSASAVSETFARGGAELCAPDLYDISTTYAFRSGRCPRALFSTSSFPLSLTFHAPQWTRSTVRPSPLLYSISVNVQLSSFHNFAEHKSGSLRRLLEGIDIGISAPEWNADGAQSNSAS